MAPTARSPASAMPGPSTTCIRPSPSRGWSSKKKGEFTAEELEPLAKVNVESLKEYDFFTYAKANDKDVVFVDPKEYHLEFDPKESMLTLHFVLPLKAPVKTKALALEVFDPSYFVDFALAEKDPVSLEKAPAGCQIGLDQAPGDDGGHGAASGGDSAGRAKFRTTVTGRRSPTRYRSNVPDEGCRRAHGARAHVGAVRPLLLTAARSILRSRKARRSATRAARAAAACRWIDRLDIRQAGGFLSGFLAHHPRRQDRRQRGVDACSGSLSLRHLPRRRARPRQGGDFVLCRRQ